MINKIVAICTSKTPLSYQRAKIWYVCYIRVSKCMCVCMKTYMKKIQYQHWLFLGDGIMDDFFLWFLDDLFL